MRKMIYLISGFLLSFLIIPTSFAASRSLMNSAQAFKPEVYVGGLVGYANLHYSRSWLLKRTGFTSVSSVDSNNWAAKVFIGYAFNAYFALETAYLILQKVDFKKVNGGDNADMEQTVIEVTGRLTIPMGQYFDLLGRAGGAYVHRKEFTANNSARYRSNNSYVPVFGGGLKINFTPKVSAYAEYDYYLKQNDLPRFNFIGGGLSYKFG